MTLDQYLQEGGVREEKLAVIYSVAPERLSIDYQAVFNLLTSENDNVRFPARDAFPELAEALTRVPNIDNLPIVAE